MSRYRRTAMWSDMNQRSKDLIESMQLQPHPEGGYYREVYRSTSRVEPLDDRSERTALTAIYFLLTAGQVSRWHRVRSDEVWCYIEGSALELRMSDGDFTVVENIRLGPLADDMHPIHVVPANVWQTARSLGEYTLVSCIVGPGFDFADFEMR